MAGRKVQESARPDSGEIALVTGGPGCKHAESMQPKTSGFPWPDWSRLCNACVVWAEEPTPHGWWHMARNRMLQNLAELSLV